MSAARSKKKNPAADAPIVPAELPGAGTPEGAALREASAAFEAGDYARTRALTRPLLEATDARVADAARDLARRVAVDPVQIAFLIGCLLVLLGIAYVYVLA
jgi:hypothetical protein